MWNLSLRMNSMRYLILLTFIVYEAQYTHGTKHLEYLKSLLSKHLPSTTDQSIVYKLQPVNNYDNVEDDTVAEWNKQEYLINGNPVDQQSFDKLDIIPNLNFGTVIKENPTTNLKENADENSKILFNSEIIYEANPGTIYKANTGTNFEGNPEIDSAENPQQALVKDKNTEWLLSETTSEKQPEIVDVKNNIHLIKDQIIQKINSLKSNIKLKNQPIIKPVVEVISEDSSFLLEEKPCNNNSITAEQSIITENPCETKSTTIEPSTTTNEPCATQLTTANPNTTQKPITTEKPIYTIKTTTTVEPIITTEPNTSPDYVICDTSPTTTEESVPITSTTARPSVSTKSTTPVEPSVSTTSTFSPKSSVLVTSTTTAGPSISTTSTISPKPIVPEISTIRPNSNTPKVDINTDCQEPIITIPSQHQIYLPPQNYYYSPMPYQVWLNECPPPLTRKNCFPSYPITANTFATKPLTLGSIPYNVQEYQKKKVNSENTKVINYIEINASPANSGPTKQRNHYGYNYQRPVYHNPILSYTLQAPGSGIPIKTTYSSYGAVHSIPTKQPITGYSTVDSVLSTDKVNTSQPSSSINLGQRKQWINSGYNRQKPTHRNPILFTYITQTPGTETPFKTTFPKSSAVYSTQTNQPIAEYPVDSSGLPATNIKINANQPSYPTNSAQAEQWINYAYYNQQLVPSNPSQSSGPEAPPGTAIPNSGVVYSTQNNQPIVGYPVDNSVLPVNNIKIDSNQPSYPTNSAQAEQWNNYAYNNQQLVPSNPPQSSGPEAPSGTAIPNSGAVYSTQNNQPIVGYPTGSSVLPANNIKIDSNQPSYPTNSAQAEQWNNYAYNNQQLVPSNPPQSSGPEAPSGTAIPNSGAVYSTQNNQPIVGYPTGSSVLPANNIKIDSNQPSYPTNSAQAEQWNNYAYNNQQLVPSNPPQSSGPEAPSGTAIPNSGVVYSTQNNQPIIGYPVDSSVLPVNNIKIDSNQPSYPTNSAQGEQWNNYAYNDQQLVPSNPPQSSGPEAPPGTAIPNSGAVYSTQNNQPIVGYPVDSSVLPVNNIKIDSNQPSYPTNSAQAEQWNNYAYNNQQLVPSNPSQSSGPEAPSETAIPNSSVVYSTQNNQPIVGYPVDSSVLPVNNIKIDSNQPSYPTNSAQAEQWNNYAYNNQQLVPSNPSQSSGPEAPSETAIPNSSVVYSTQNNQPIVGYPADSSVLPANNIKIDSNQPSYPINSAQAEQWINYAYNNQQLVPSNPSQSSGQEAPSGTAIPNYSSGYSTETIVPIAVYPTGDSVSPGKQTNLANPEYIDQNQYYDAVSEANGSGAPLRGDIRFGEDYTSVNPFEQSGGEETLPYTLKQRRQAVAISNKQTSVRNNSNVKMPISSLPLPDKPVVEQTEDENLAALDTKPKTPLVQTKRLAVKGKTPTIKIESPNAGTTGTPVTTTKSLVSKSDDDINLKLVKKMLNSKSA